MGRLGTVHLSPILYIVNFSHFLFPSFKKLYVRLIKWSTKYWLQFDIELAKNVYNSPKLPILAILPLLETPEQPECRGYGILRFIILSWFSSILSIPMYLYISYFYFIFLGLKLRLQRKKAALSTKIQVIKKCKQ